MCLPCLCLTVHIVPPESDHTDCRRLGRWCRRAAADSAVARAHVSVCRAARLVRVHDADRVAELLQLELDFISCRSINDEHVDEFIR